jgi:hypothetical protein
MHNQEAPQPTDLYQYTSLDGLLAIAKSRTLRLSHVLYQNDSSEYYHGLELFKKVIVEEFPNKFLLNIVNGFLNNIKSIDVYTASFTTQPDLLSQWRGYCPNGGLSYMIDNQVLNDTVKHPSLTLRKCIYRKEEQLDAIRSLIAPHRNVDPSNITIGTSKLLRILKPMIANSAAIFKNEKFEEEAEWRIMTTRDYNYEGTTHIMEAKEYPQAYTNVEYRAGKTTLIPFVTIPLGKTILPSDNEKQVPEQLFKNIYISPGPNSELCRNACQMFIGSGCEVKPSDIPYKNW